MPSLQKFLFQYHEKCLKLFQNPKEMKAAQCNDRVRFPEECAMKYIARLIRHLPDKFWTSIELHELYQKNGGEEKNCS